MSRFTVPPEVEAFTGRYFVPDMSLPIGDLLYDNRHHGLHIEGNTWVFGVDTRLMLEGGLIYFSDGCWMSLSRKTFPVEGMRAYREIPFEKLPWMQPGQVWWTSEGVREVTPDMAAEFIESHRRLLELRQRDSGVLAGV